MRKFWKKTEGFTLVELIVVIAVLGILAGVGTVGYSGYVKKANMAADQQLVSEAMHALELYHYSNPTQNTDGTTVVLALAPEDNETTGFGDDAMKAVFGDGWKDNLFLKYDGWKSASLTGSSFEGNEAELLDTVDELTGTLSNFLKDYNGNADGFFPYLEKIGVDKNNSTAAANAAVLYVGEAVKKANQEKISEILSGVPGKIVTQMNTGGYSAIDPNTIMLETAGALQSELGGSTMAAAALMYAYAESYAMATGQELEIDVNNITDGSSGLREVQRAFTNLMNMGSMTQDQIGAMMTWGGIVADPEDSTKYIQKDGAAFQKDAQAVMSTMDAVNNASGLFMDKLGQENLYADTSVRDMVITYLTGVDGAVMLVLQNGKVHQLAELPN